MALSLRTRLTLWYSALLLLAVVLFSATVLWLQWHLMLRQADESLEAMAVAAANVVEAELAEHATLDQATREMLDVVGHREFAVAVIDGDGRVIDDAAAPLSLVARDVSRDGRGPRSVAGANGRSWRLMLRPGAADSHRFTVAIAAPMDEIEEEARILAKACAIGVPFVMTIAVAGGWWLGRRGLRPLETMAGQAHAITARTPEARLDVDGSAPELDAVATSFNHLLDRLGSALATQRRFMADASHELRTPVSIMRTAADVTLAQPHRDEAEYREALDAVSQQSERLARLVDDMLVLARADAGGYPVARAEVDLDAIVTASVREFVPRARERRVRLESAVQPVTVVADAALLRRMLGNLLSNALTYTPAGGRVDVAIVPRTGAIAVQVSDSGPGIAAADRERIFERFVRLDPARAEGGAGLGLSIARWIAETHGGRLELLTSGPEGSVFEAILPA
jgi:heavy metal sensor kinase